LALDFLLTFLFKKKVSLCFFRKEESYFSLMNLIDTHAHIYQEDFLADIDDIMLRAKENGVSKIYLPNVDVSSIKELKDLVAKNSDLFIPMMGLHPCYVKEDYKEQLAIIEKELREGKYAAVGEIGIDLHWDKTFFVQQQDAFRTQIRWAIELKLPIIIHARESLQEIFQILDEEYRDGLKGIFHCFGGTIEDAQKIISYGFKLGIGGTVTYKNSKLPEVLKNVDLQHIVLETDAPYLPPVPHRGQRNESSYVKLVALKLCDIYGISLEEVAKITTQNAEQLFNLKS
jgi:TatD DNase family protein